MPALNAYNTKVAVWGKLARAVLARPEQVAFFVNEGIEQSEIEAVSKTEALAEAADRAQREQTQKLKLLAPQSATVVKSLVGLFSTFNLRLPNVIRDLKAAKDEETANLASDIHFSSKAVPRIASDKESNVSDEDILLGEEEIIEGDPETPDEPATPVENEGYDRQSRSQQALSDAATRLSKYIEANPKLAEAFLKRKMPQTFLQDLKTHGESLLKLRDERLIALAKRKVATQNEYDAVQAHMEARKVIEPTTTMLAKKHPELDALLVSNLQRKPADQPRAKSKSAAAKAKTKSKK